MSNIKVVSQTQHIYVDPATSSVSVINAGPMGPRGYQGETGAQGPEGPIVYSIDGGTPSSTYDGSTVDGGTP